MVVKNVTVNNCTPETIVIGRRGTFETMQVVFDLTYLIENYGDGTAVLALKRSQDSSAYPAVAAQDGNTLTWVVSEVDTYYVGAGECQLMWYVDEGLAKTIIYPMVVMRDILSTSEEAPDAYQEWVDNLTALGAETLQNAQDAAQSASDAESAKGDAIAAKEAAEEAAEKAEEASVHSPVIQGGYWYIWNNGQYVNTGVQAEGQKGDKGDPGEKGETGNGIASIAKTGTSGLVDTYTVTYTDGTTTTFTVTNGAKGDKGDTGETGNGIASITKTGTSGNVDTYTITYTNGQTTTFTVTNGAVSSVAGKTGAVTLDANDVAFSESGTYDDGTVGKELSNQKNAIDQKAPVIINSASGDIASFADGADGMQIRKIVGTIVPVQSGTGDPSPDNVRPISGWTGCNIIGTTINIISGDPIKTINNAIINAENIIISNNYLSIDVYPCPKTTMLYAWRSIGGPDTKIGFSNNPNLDFNDYVDDVYTYTNFCPYNNQYGYVYVTRAKNALNPHYSVSVGGFYQSTEKGSKQTLPINWQTEAGTIYGGTVTLNEDGSADLVSEWQYALLKNLPWNYYSASAYFRTDVLNNATPGMNNVNNNVVKSSAYKTLAANGWDGAGSINVSTGSRICIMDRDYTTVSDFISAMGETQIIYKLKTPQTYHLTPEQVGGFLSTYYGTNNVWIDTGSITGCDYPADTKLYIDGLTAPDEDMIADGLIASGKYFTVNNQLYLSTAQIAAGAQIIPGSNCTATTLVEALNALNT